MPNYHSFREWPKVTLGSVVKPTLKKPKKPKSRGVASLVLWLDGADIDTMWQDSDGLIAVTTDGDPVGKWDDKSGEGNHFTQTVVADKPAYKANHQNGNSVIESAGGTLDIRGLTRVGSVMSQQTDFTIFHVAYTNSGVRACVWAQTTDTSSVSIAASYIDTGTNKTGCELYDSNGDQYAVNTVAAGLAAYHQSTSVYELPSFYSRLDGTQGATKTTIGDGVFSSSITRLCSAYTWQRPLKGFLAELMIYDRTLSLAEIEGIEAGLKDKWATP